jgi:glutathione S-transferase
MGKRILHHMPFCPLSRKIIFGLKEKELEYQEVIEKIWDISSQALEASIYGEIPVLKDHIFVCSNDYIAMEYLDEVYSPTLLGEHTHERIETRRIVSWFDRVFYQDVYLTVFYERALKRYVEVKSPDMALLKKGRQSLHEHMTQLDQLAEKRTYLNGKGFSWADIAGAAHLSCLDYLGEIFWEQFLFAKEWYMKIKSRPAFRGFLGQNFPGISPVHCYGNLDF